MKKTTTTPDYRQSIIDTMKDAGTYRETYSFVIDTLSHLMEERDKARESYLKSGSDTTTTYGPSGNTKKNPSLQIWIDLEKIVLTLERELGLTPYGLLRIKNSAADLDELESLLNVEAEGTNSD